METSIDIVYAEVFEILKNISKEKVALIPRDIILRIKEKRNVRYEVNIDWSKELDESQISKDAINIIGYFNYEYWTQDKEEKLKLKKIYSENRKEKLKRLGINVEEISNDNIFDKENDRQEATYLAVKEETSFGKVKNTLTNFIKSIFK